MALEIVCEPQALHICDDTPNHYAYEIGTIARCKVCGVYRRLGWDEYGRTWQRISERRAKRLIARCNNGS